MIVSIPYGRTETQNSVELAWSHTAWGAGRSRGGEGFWQATAGWPAWAPAAPPTAGCGLAVFSLRGAGLSRRPREPGGDEKEPCGLGHLFPMTPPHSVDCSLTFLQSASFKALLAGRAF